MRHKSSFGIHDANDFLNNMVLPQYQEFLKKNSSSRAALLTFMLVYHMYEWVHCCAFSQEHFLETYPTDKHMCVFFETARRICNGTKHFAQRADTTVQSGFSSGFSDGFARPLNVTLAGNRQESADRLLHELVQFWERQKQVGAF
ncbi:MAG: hypothetical protein OXP75_09150 [Rhodospirillales bacterium]|nr:hypothetical protein [Rhodospirillales bacterium]